MHCAKCGNQLQAHWISCPKCGEALHQEASTNEPVSTFSIIKSVLTCLLILLIAGINIYSRPPQATNTAQHSAKKDIFMTVWVTQNYVAILNDNDFEWEFPLISIAAGGDSYSLHSKSVKINEKVLYDLSNFVNNSGERLDEKKYALKNITINTNNASGGLKLIK